MLSKMIYGKRKTVKYEWKCWLNEKQFVYSVSTWRPSKLLVLFGSFDMSIFWYGQK